VPVVLPTIKLKSSQNSTSHQQQLKTTTLTTTTTNRTTTTSKTTVERKSFKSKMTRARATCSAVVEIEGVRLRRIP